MTWRSDTSEINAYFGLNGGVAAGYPLAFYGNLPDNPYFNTPPGRVRPIMGFGRVWGNLSDVRSALGWATAAEVGYVMRVRPIPGAPILHMTAPAGGRTRWLSNDRNRFWGFTDGLGGLSLSAQAATTPEAGTPTLPTETLVVPTATEAATADIAITTEAAYQPFENGFMIWRADTGSVLVFPAQSAVQFFEQGQYEGLPDNPVTDPVPDGRLLPTSGFGRVWGNFPDVRSALGWALDAEQSYTATLHTVYVMSPDGVKLIPGQCFNVPGGSGAAQYPQFVGDVVSWGYVDSCE